MIRRRRRVLKPRPDLADVPVSIESLVKEYAGGYRAVDDVTFRVERGQVVGLLGPNGAGKTTTLRVLVGLITPTAGELHVFGEPVVPGAPVLARLGAFIEGPGFLPHLSGRENLRLYWAATGRPADEADFDTALEIAGLGASIDRRVKSYSHGMKQRLGIAQAMLGLPELLVLDEPTNGLDPPQIAEMREVMQRYAETGTHGRGVLPPARRGRADLHARRRHAQGQARRGRLGRRHRRRRRRPTRGDDPDARRRCWRRPASPRRSCPPAAPSRTCSSA